MLVLLWPDDPSAEKECDAASPSAPSDLTITAATADRRITPIRLLMLLPPVVCASSLLAGRAEDEEQAEAAPVEAWWVPLTLLLLLLPLLPLLPRPTEPPPAPLLRALLPLLLFPLPAPPASLSLECVILRSLLEIWW